MKNLLALSLFAVFLADVLGCTSTIPSCRLTKCLKKDPKVKPNCYCWGDPHCTSFDGLKNDYQGTCRHIAVKNSDAAKSGVPAFTLYQKNENRAGKNLEFEGRRVSFVRYVELEAFGQLIRLGLKGNLEVNGRVTAAPFIYPPGQDCNLPCDIYIERIGTNGLVLRTSFELAVSLEGDGTNDGALYIAPPAKLKGYTQGACGTYDGNTQNDWTMINGEVSAKVNDFIDSWIVHDLDDPTCVKTPEEEQCPPEKKAKAEAACKPLNDQAGYFKDCLANAEVAAEAKNIYDDCVFDNCIGDNPCDSFKELATVCQAKLGKKINDWRTGECAPSCPVDMTWEINANVIQPSCDNEKPDLTHNSEKDALCICNAGLIYDTEYKKCIKPENCGCADQFGGMHAAGESWINNGCTATRLCNKDHTITDTPFSCDDSEVCENKEGESRCVCKPGYEKKDNECVQIPACTRFPNACGDHSQCQNTNEGADFECICDAGYMKVGEACHLIPPPTTTTRAPVCRQECETVCH